MYFLYIYCYNPLFVGALIYFKWIFFHLKTLDISPTFSDSGYSVSGNKERQLNNNKHIVYFLHGILLIHNVHTEKSV